MFSSNILKVFHLYFVVYLQVRCLDFNNFGSITIPPALPRVCFWKGQTIKHFSDMLIGKDGLYGALQVIIILCYFFASVLCVSFWFLTSTPFLCLFIVFHFFCQIKDEAETCYAETDGAWASTAKNSNIQKALQRVLGNSFSDKVKCMRVG